jgi:CrcB protein
VNWIGSFVLGFITQFLADRNADPRWRLFVGVGLLGSFTTFSTFALETFNFLQNSKFLLGIIYLFGSLAVGVGSAAFGITVASFLPSNEDEN